MRSPTGEVILGRDYVFGSACSWLEPLRGPNGLDLSRLKKTSNLARTTFRGIYDPCSFRFFKFRGGVATEINAVNYVFLEVGHLWHAGRSVQLPQDLKKELIVILNLFCS
ncbi:hypothetical protein IC575_031033 [Cucumis melo]